METPALFDDDAVGGADADDPAIWGPPDRPAPQPRRSAYRRRRAETPWTRAVAVGAVFTVTS
ncbi:hypothetical protein ACFQX7_29945 [Luedemannella flava]